MALHNPNSIKLPPLEITKMDALEKMENNKCISNFIDSKLLLDSDFNNLYIDINKKSEKIFYYIDSFKHRKSDFDYNVERGNGSSISISIPNDVKLDSKLKNEIKEIFVEATGAFETDEEFENNFLNMQKGEYQKLKDKVVSLSQEIQDSLNKFEKEKGKKLNILSHTVINFCRDCNNIISLGRLRQSKCSCCEKIKNTSNIVTITVFHFNKELNNFIKKNCWLEYGVDNLLKKKQFTTLTGFYVLGHSGNWHEIDNIAESRKMNYRFFCECKSGKELKPKDIFIFSGKMGDIGCTRGYIFTTQTKMKEELIRLARSKNIDIISNVLNKNTDELLKEIKEK